MVKNLPANAGDTRYTGSIPGSESPLKQEMATCSCFLPRKLHGQSSLVGYSHGVAELDATEHTQFKRIGT